MFTIDRVGYEQDGLYDKAKAIAEQLNFVIDKNATSCLLVEIGKLSLKIKGYSSFHAEFSREFWKKRSSEGKKQGLVRACKPHKGLKIIDATAGWGRDSAILASLGAEVLMIERHPVIATLLEDALARRTEIDSKKIQLSLYKGDAFTYLRALDQRNYPDIIYIDPMHPQRTKSALVKKEMQLLQCMIGSDEDARELIELAKTRTKYKVVVKWPQKIESLSPADFSVEGKTVRFDIYNALKKS